MSAIDSSPLAFLVAPDDLGAFMSKHWERGPAVFRATPQRRAFFEGLASFAELARLASICEEEGEPLEFGVDVNAARYVGGQRETPNGEVADSATLERLFHEEGCTMQFHQPQRFSDEAWRLLAALERQLGCLVGCNAYLTPAGTQGLAPHWDDVEIFVVQTEGSKHWRLYPPPTAPAGAAPGTRAEMLAACHLANQVSGDLEQEEIGEPAMEVTLEVGDVLYMPRGTIHQATAQQGGPSAHLTVSTYQRWSAADLLQYTVSVALANPSLQPLLPASLKAGLPPGFLSAAGACGDAAAAAAMAAASGGFGAEGAAAMAAMAAKTAAGMVSKAGGKGKGGKAAAAGSADAGSGGAADRAGLARQLAAACRALADCLEGEEGEQQLGPRLLGTAADAMAEDFMRSRLPPHPEQLPPRGLPPSLQDSVQCVGASYFRLVPLNGKDEGGCSPDCDEDHDHSHPHGSHHSNGAACGTGCQDHDHDHDHESGSESEEEDEHEDEHADGEGGAAAAAGCCSPPAWVRLVSCLRNDRGTHMISGGGEEEEEDEDDSGSESESDGSEGDVEELAARAAAACAAAAAAAAGRKRKAPAGGEEEEEGSGSGSEGEEEEEEEEEEEGSQEDLVFPAEFAPALVQLLGSAPDAPLGGGRPVRVADIALPDPELQLQVATALWEAGVLCTVKPAPAAGKAAAGAAKKSGKQQGKQAKQQGEKASAADAAAKQAKQQSEQAAAGKQAKQPKQQEQRKQGKQQEGQQKQGGSGKPGSKKGSGGGGGAAAGPKAKKQKA